MAIATMETEVVVRIKRAAVIKIITIKRERITGRDKVLVEWTVGKEAPERKWLHEDDALVSHLDVILEGT